MSGNAVHERIDRRRARTHQALTEAFVSLMLTKRYDDFGVADIVERANVGRSTFYEHFGSKDALLRASMNGLLEVLAEAGATGAVSPRLRKVIDHFWENRRLGRMVFSHPLRILIERQLADIIGVRLGERRKLAAMQIAAAQLTALEAWVTGGASATPEEMSQAMAATSRLSSTL